MVRRPGWFDDQFDGGERTLGSHALFAPPRGASVPLVGETLKLLLHAAPEPPPGSMIAA